MRIDRTSTNESPGQFIDNYIFFFHKIESKIIHHVSNKNKPFFWFLFSFDVYKVANHGEFKFLVKYLTANTIWYDNLRPFLTTNQTPVNHETNSKNPQNLLFKFCFTACVPVCMCESE